MSSASWVFESSTRRTSAIAALFSDSQSTMESEQAEKDVCAAIRAGWRPTVTQAWDDYADDMEVLVANDWSPVRSVRLAGGAATGRRGGRLKWDGKRRAGVMR